MRKGFGKLWLVCLALVLALAVCGVGYAHWGDTLNIEGTLITGEWHCGCSHGFWKTHPDEWGPTGYDPGASFNSTFECDAFDPDITLLAALKLQGEGSVLNALAREAVAALLNVAHPDVDYPLTPGEVIEKVQQAVEGTQYEATKDELAAYNKDSLGGCPLG